MNNNVQFNQMSDLVLNHLAEQLYLQGYCVVNDLLPLTLIESLTRRITHPDAILEPAGIGRLDDHHINQTIRTDTIHWLDPKHTIDALYLSAMEALRLAINKRLFLGLFDYESHFAHYPPNGFYKKHQDAFTGQSNRILTTVLYLNNQWSENDGGELIIYNLSGDQIMCVEPKAGCFVIFLSDEFPHEVIKTKKDRYSIAGWFRINSSTEHKVDPPL